MRFYDNALYKSIFLLTYKKFSCRREAARCFVSLVIVIGVIEYFAKLLNVIRNYAHE